jgi:hypothetical protein
MADNEPLVVEQPLIIMFRQDQRILCHLYPADGDNYQGYGLLVCDLVRHIAAAFKVDEDAVWKWVELERAHHTTEIKWPSPTQGPGFSIGSDGRQSRRP